MSDSFRKVKTCSKSNRTSECMEFVLDTCHVEFLQAKATQSKSIYTSGSTVKKFSLSLSLSLSLSDRLQYKRSLDLLDIKRFILMTDVLPI